MTHVDTLLDAIDPDDPLGRLALADALEEDGQDALAAWWREFATDQKPGCSDNPLTWWWADGGSVLPEEAKPYILCRPLFDLLEGRRAGGMSFVYQTTAARVYHDLAGAECKVRSMYRIETLGRVVHVADERYGVLDGCPYIAFDDLIRTKSADIIAGIGYVATRGLYEWSFIAPVRRLACAYARDELVRRCLAPEYTRGNG